MKFTSGFILLFILTFFVQCYIGHAQSIQEDYAFLRKLPPEPTLQDTLSQYAQQANTLWDHKKNNLSYACDFLSLVSKNKAEAYYKQASLFYFWSLKNADFETEKDAIKDEVQRILPLVTDSTKKKWETYLNEKNPKLFKEIKGFWNIQDPFSATPVNERLIEHLRRINYAKEHFTKNDNTVYGTDDRGLFYVRLGAPDRITKLHIDFNGVYNPVNLRFVHLPPTIIINSDLELWTYNNENGHEKYTYLFGKDDGYTEYGLRKNALELVDANAQGFPDGLVQLGILERLSAHSSFYQSLYSEYVFKSRVGGDGFFSTQNREFFRYYNQQKNALRSKTTLKYATEKLELNQKVFRFIDKNTNRNKYLLSVQSIPDKKHTSFDATFLSNRIFAYNDNWDLLANTDELSNINKQNKLSPHIYQVDDAIAHKNLYFSSELIDTTRNGIALPGRVYSKASAIIASTGKQKLKLPEPLPVTDSFLISDVVLSADQESDFDSTFPITPSMDNTFKEASSIMIYFEAYNIPKGGYAFTYFFKKDQWLLGHKKLDRTEITILADKTSGHDRQLFSINLQDLKSGSYEVVFQFRPLGINSNIKPIKKKVEIKIKK